MASGRHLEDFVPLKVNLILDCEDSVVEDNLRHAATLGYEVVTISEPKSGAVSICGTAPSLKDTIKDLKGEVWAINGTHDYFVDNNVKFDVCFLWDAHEMLCRYVNKPQKHITYLCASHCHPKLFEKLKGYNVKLFHTNIGPIVKPLIRSLGWDQPIFNGGSAGCTRAPAIAYGMGFREIHIHGADASFDKNQDTHVSRDDRVDFGSDELEVLCLGKLFNTTPWMSRQAEEIAHIRFALMDSKFYVHGDGLVPHVAEIYGFHIRNNN